MSLLTDAQWAAFRAAIRQVTGTFFTATVYLVPRTHTMGDKGRPGTWTSGSPIELSAMVQEPTHELTTKLWGPEFKAELLLLFDTRHLAERATAHGAPLPFNEKTHITVDIRPGQVFRQAGGLRRDAQVNPHASEPQELLAYLPLVEVKE